MLGTSFFCGFAHSLRGSLSRHFSVFPLYHCKKGIARTYSITFSYMRYTCHFSRPAKAVDTLFVSQEVPSELPLKHEKQQGSLLTAFLI